MEWILKEGKMSIILVHNRVMWRAFVNTVMNFRLAQEIGTIDCLSEYEILKDCSMELVS
jgi:hypothetical protein